MTVLGGAKDLPPSLVGATANEHDERFDRVKSP